MTQEQNRGSRSNAVRRNRYSRFIECSSFCIFENEFTKAVMDCAIVMLLSLFAESEKYHSPAGRISRLSDPQKNATPFGVAFFIFANGSILEVMFALRASAEILYLLCAKMHLHESFICATIKKRT
jgi:hypothetical protein